MPRIEILLIEDNPGDVELTREALRESKILCHLNVADDGHQGMAFLRHHNPYEDAPRPDLILLDLNMPGKDGREVLKEIKGDEDLRSIPVVILTTSEDEEDILRAHELHANAYIPKPALIDEFVSRIQAIQDFFFTISRLPRRSLPLRDLITKSDGLCRQIIEHIQQDYIPVAQEVERLIRPRKKEPVPNLPDSALVTSSRKIESVQDYLTDLLDEFSQFGEEVYKRASGPG